MAEENNRRQYTLVRDLPVGTHPNTAIPTIRENLVALYPELEGTDFRVWPRRGNRRDGSVRHHYLVDVPATPAEPEPPHPPVLGTATLLLDGNEGVIVESGQVEQWQDQSGTDCHFEKLSGESVTHSDPDGDGNRWVQNTTFSTYAMESVLNANDVFDGSGQVVYLAIVCRNNAHASGNRSLFGQHNAANASNSLNWRIFTASTAWNYQRGTTSPIVNFAGSPSNSATLVELRRRPGGVDVEARVNGGAWVDTGINLGGGVAALPMRIFSDQHIAFIFGRDTVLDGAEEAALHAYLAGRYTGLSLS